MAAHESQLAVLGPVRIPFQEMLDLRRLAILVSAEDADIEIEARIFEVIRIAAVKGGLLLRSENEPDVVVAFETIEVVSAALVKGDHVGAQSRFLFALLFDFRDDLLAGRGGLLRRHARFQRRLDARRYILG